jgi:hypothetical protein
MTSSRLFEQIYSNTNKIYYHGSGNTNLTEIERDDDRPFFISNDIGYAMSYVRRVAKGEIGALYRCRLDSKMDIFNARSEKDASWLKDKLTEYFIEAGCKSRASKEMVPGLARSLARRIVDDFALEDWFDSIDHAIREHCSDFTIPRRAEVLEIVRDGGYDGFYNYEMNRTTGADGNGIGIFAGSIGHVRLIQKALMKWRGDEGTMKFYGDGWMPIGKKARTTADRRYEKVGHELHKT